MNSKVLVDEFIAQKLLAVVGVSRSKQKFGNTIFIDLKSKGYKVFAINPNVESVEGEKCYPNLAALPEKVGGVIFVVPPAVVEKALPDVKAAGIERVWMQQGSSSPAAVEFCQQNNIKCVAGECILMFAAPDAWYHRFHRWINKVSGKLPA